MDLRVYRIFNNAVLALLTLAAAAIWLGIFSRPDSLLRITFCDVGQGDAVLIRTPQNKKILIDGGPDDQVLTCLSQHLPFYERRIDLIVLTHPHADHVGGLIDVLESYNVGAIVHNQIAYHSADYQKFLDLAAERGLSQVAVNAGDQIGIDSLLHLDVWYPPGDREKILGARFDPFDDQDVNDSSLVFQLVCGDFALLFTGDAPADVQKYILNEGLVSPAAVLKVAHHGGRDGVDEDFLKKLAPRLAVISLGPDNRYGHPHKETLKKLQDADVLIKRTDLNGTIGVVSDCKDWWIE